MDGGRPSLQDLIRGRQQSGFVGRQGQIVQFQENLGFAVNDERRRFLFNIHGDAGVGKTYLTKQLLQISRDVGALTAYVDESVDDVVSAMIVMSRDFNGGGVRLAEFEKRATVYRKRRQELESDPQAPDGVASFLTKAAVTIGLQAVRDVPFAGSLLAPLDSAIVAEQVNQARAYLVRKLGEHADVRLLLSPIEELTPMFVTGLERPSAGRYVALFFDTYERTAPFLDRWLRDLYAGRYGDLPVTLITTMSGQNPLNPNMWGEYLPVIADVPLEPFSETEARQFLASENINDEPTIQVILNLSGRLPMWLTTLADARPNNPADIGDPAGNAVERFLKWEDDPTRRAIAVTAALPRNLNQDVLTIIGPPNKASELFEWLCRLPFVSRQAESWKYHEVVRSAMLRLQRAQSPNEWRSNHTALAQANAQWAKDAVGETDQTWANPDWIDRTREEIYHLLCANSVNNLPLALASAVKAAEHSTARARQWAALLIDAGNDTDNPELSRWGRRLRDGIRDSDLTQYLGYLIDAAHLDNARLTIALEERGETHRLSGRNDEALADFNRAIELDPDDVRALGSRGEVFLAADRYDEALADFNRAIELDPGYRWVVSWRGVTYSMMRRYDEALADLSRAIELDPGDDSALAWRGETYRLMRRYDEALADFNRAIELDPDYAWALGSRGQVFLAGDRDDEALADFNRAIELDPDYAWALGSRGQVFLAGDRYDEALADFNRAIELDPDAASAHAWRGVTYRLMRCYDEALADLNRAIELDPDYAWALGSRGRAYLAMKRYDEALADFDRAIELDSGDAWVLGGRGQAYLAMKRYGEALADFNRAIELDPGDDSALAWRGEGYRLMRRYDEALADFNRAIELDPGDDSALAWRGETYRLMRRYDEALADFNRAIELDPGDAWALGSRGQAYLAMKRYDEALADFNRAIELDPGYRWVTSWRGITYSITHRYDEALADFNRAIELDPGDAWALGGRGYAYLAMKRYDEALADFNHSIELDPDDASIIAWRGLTHLLMDHRDTALADLALAKEIDTEDAEACAVRSASYRLMGLHEGALVELDRAKELDLPLTDMVTQFIAHIINDKRTESDVGEEHFTPE